MFSTSDYLTVEYDPTLDAWAVYDGRGLLDAYDSRGEAAKAAAAMGRRDRSYTHVDVYGRDGSYEDTIQFGGRAGGPADGMAEATGQMLLVGGGTMMGIGAIDAIGEMF
jgi:hypothetical protein